MSKVKELITIHEAAKAVGMGHDRLRPICIAAGIAVRWGGTNKHPWIKVALADVERVLMSRRAVDPGSVPAQRRLSRKLDPAVRC